MTASSASASPALSTYTPDASAVQEVVLKSGGFYHHFRGKDHVSMPVTLLAVLLGGGSLESTGAAVPDDLWSLARRMVSNAQMGQNEDVGDAGRRVEAFLAEILAMDRHARGAVDLEQHEKTARSAEDVSAEGVDMLSVSTATRDALMEAGITTIGELQSFTPEGLFAHVEAMTPAMVQEIRKALAAKSAALFGEEVRSAA